MMIQFMYMTLKQINYDHAFLHTWSRRCFVMGRQAAGVLNGHLEGKHLLIAVEMAAISFQMVKIKLSSYGSMGHPKNVFKYKVVSGDQVARLLGHQLTVRDCWHPNYPLLVSSSWDGLLSRWELPGTDTGQATNNRIRGSIEDDMFRVVHL